MFTEFYVEVLSKAKSLEIQTVLVQYQIKILYNQPVLDCYYCITEDIHKTSIIEQFLINIDISNNNVQKVQKIVYVPQNY